MTAMTTPVLFAPPADEERYGAMDPDLFDATVPAGSVARWPRNRRNTP